MTATTLKTEDQVSVTYDVTVAATLTNQAKNQLTSAESYTIDSPTMYKLASQELQEIKLLQKGVDEKRTSITGPLNQAVRAVNELFRAPANFLDQAENTLKAAMLKWNNEQLLIAQKAQEAAQAQAKAESDRLAATKKEQENIAKAAQQKAQEEAAAGNQDAAAKQIAIAQEAQQAASIADLTSQVVTVTPVAVAPAKVSGISQRTTYAAQVTNLLELVKAVATGDAPIECLQADTKFLGAQARAFKKDGKLYPGVQSVAEQTIAARAA